jgi:hypothetical protein
MKKFRNIIETTDMPKGGDERAFWDKHIVVKKKYPLETENQFTSKAKKAKRAADYDDEDSRAVYEAAERADKKSVLVTQVRVNPETNEKKITRFIRRQPAGKINIGEALDPVGREDKDIDNDGRYTKTDQYLRARRRAIARAKAMKEDAMHNAEINHDIYKKSNRRAKRDEFKEGIDQLDELSPKTLGSYIQKATVNRAEIEKKRDKIADQKKKVDYTDWDMDDALGRDQEATTVRSKLRAAQRAVSDKLDANDKTLRRKSFRRDYGVYRALNKLKEEVELKEAVVFKVGSMKLNDGTTVQITKESADLLNGLFNQLHSGNKSKMEERLMSGTKGFSEILSFAKEAK